MGNCPGGNCPGGELSGWGIVRVGNCPPGNCPSGNCPSGNCPDGELSGNRYKILQFSLLKDAFSSGLVTLAIIIILYVPLGSLIDG